MEKSPYLTVVDPGHNSQTDHDLEFVPLPYFPWDMRPSGHPLDAEECATALHLGHGNIQSAARLLKVPPHRLHRLVLATPRLQRVREEALELTLSAAEEVPIQTLFDDGADARRKEWASTAVLKSRLGRNSPLAPASGDTKADVVVGGGRIVLRWLGEGDDDGGSPDSAA